jgi:hypothetical protein
MRDKTHLDQIVRWGNFVRENPQAWKSEHTEFINAQFKKSEAFFNRLSKTEGGRSKILKLINLKRNLVK